MKTVINGNAAWETCPRLPQVLAPRRLRPAWRPTRAYEFIFELAKTGKYFCDAEAVALPPSEATIERGRYDHETVCSGAVFRLSDNMRNPA